MDVYDRRIIPPNSPPLCVLAYLTAKGKVCSYRVAGGVAHTHQCRTSQFIAGIKDFKQLIEVMPNHSPAIKLNL
jgi:hypothetical protein